MDLLHENVVTLHQPDAQPQAQIFRRGDVADAGTALAEWTMAVDEILA